MLEESNRENQGVQENIPLSAALFLPLFYLTLQLARFFEEKTAQNLSSKPQTTSFYDVYLNAQQ